MVYLKTYFYVEHEIKFLVANLLESYEHIDKFIICEFNRTHTGMPRHMIGWDVIKDYFPKDKVDKVLYLPLDISHLTIEAYDNEDMIHARNEPVMRSVFMKAIEFSDDDFIVSVDADEIIYSDSYPEIIEFVNSNGPCQLNLHQFFYKMTYLWKDKDFIAPTALQYKHFKDRFPCNLRYEGVIFPKKAGCHFSWCMSPKEMVYKLHTYSHPRYRHLADENILEKAIRDKKYPFDDTDFNIEEIEITSNILPRKMIDAGLIK
tara:strand:- start:279 stop:1061 length:783 start_codon:yes stop_codon:yes gene_type:complete